MTAVITMNTLAAPLGFLAAGQVLEHWGVVPLFTARRRGITCMAVVYGAIVLRIRDADVAPSPSRSRPDKATAAGAGTESRRRSLFPSPYLRQVA